MTQANNPLHGLTLEMIVTRLAGTLWLGGISEKDRHQLF